MSFLIVSTALRPGNRTALVAHALRDAFADAGENSEVVDLAALTLPMCDGGSCFQDPAVRTATARVKAARGIVLCFPVYNHQANAAAKNFVEVTNDGWNSKVIGLVANGGTDRSYLAPLSLANSLMVDHRCVIVPRFVFVAASSFSAEGQLPPDGEIKSRLADLTLEVVHLAPHWPVQLGST